MVLEGAGFLHQRRRVLAGFLQRAHLLAQLVAARLPTLGRSDRLAPIQIEGAKIAQQRGGVQSARA